MQRKFKNWMIQWVIIFFVILALIEFSPYAFAPVILKKSFSRKELRNELEQYSGIKNETDSVSAEKKDKYLGEHVIHPYLGFVNDPLEIHNRFGFLGSDPLVKESQDTIHICLLGGSVAKQLYQFSGDYLKNQLKKYPEYRNKEINLILIALGGFKQPQQLLALNYFISLGAEYDIVINLDGFNEMVLPFSDNLAFNIHPSFPRHWSIYSRKHINPKTQMLLYEQSQLKEKEYNLRKVFNRSFLKYSNMGLLFWKVLDNKKKNKIVEIDQHLRKEIQNSLTTFQSTGPPYHFKDTLKYFSEQAELWEMSSKQMNALGNAFDFNYYHFLQPNQYFDGSKKLTKEELKTAYKSGDYDYKTAVRKSYPMLREKGRKMVEENIRFKDLTMIFAKEPGTVYSDICCHFNQYGYNAIADTIAAFIANN